MLNPYFFSITINLIAGRLLSSSACVLFGLTVVYYGKNLTKSPTIFDYITKIFEDFFSKIPTEEKDEKLIF
jgi:hypothetical protein